MNKCLSRNSYIIYAYQHDNNQRTTAVFINLKINRRDIFTRTQNAQTQSPDNDFHQLIFPKYVAKTNSRTNCSNRVVLTTRSERVVPTLFCRSGNFTVRIWFQIKTLFWIFLLSKEWWLRILLAGEYRCVLPIIREQSIDESHRW